MSQHVFSRVAGFQLIIIPRAPFRIKHGDVDSHSIHVAYESPGGQLLATVIPDAGGYRSELGENTISLLDVLDVERGPETAEWRIETSLFSCCWPQGYALCSNNFPNDPGPFDLIGPNREMIYVQHPKTLPDVADMCGPGQSIVGIERGADAEWIDLQYEHDSRFWHQRHVVVRNTDGRIAVTMQAPVAFAEAAMEATDAVVRSLKPYPTI